MGIKTDKNRLKRGKSCLCLFGAGEICVLFCLGNLFLVMVPVYADDADADTSAWYHSIFVEAALQYQAPGTLSGFPQSLGGRGALGYEFRNLRFFFSSGYSHAIESTTYVQRYSFVPLALGMGYHLPIKYNFGVQADLGGGVYLSQTTHYANWFDLQEGALSDKEERAFFAEGRVYATYQLPINMLRLYAGGGVDLVFETKPKLFPVVELGLNIKPFIRLGKRSKTENTQAAASAAETSAESQATQTSSSQPQPASQAAEPQATQTSDQPQPASQAAEPQATQASGQAQPAAQATEPQAAQASTSQPQPASQAAQPQATQASGSQPQSASQVTESQAAQTSSSQPQPASQAAQPQTTQASSSQPQSASQVAEPQAAQTSSSQPQPASQATQPQSAAQATEPQATQTASSQSQSAAQVTEPQATQATSQPQSASQAAQPQTTQASGQSQPAAQATAQQSTQASGSQPQSASQTTEPQAAQASSSQAQPVSQAAEPQATQASSSQPQSAPQAAESQTTQASAQPQPAPQSTQPQATQVSDQPQAVSGPAESQAVGVSVNTRPESENKWTTLFETAVFFEPDTTNLIGQSRSQLNDVGRRLQAEPRARLVLEGNSAPQGTEEGQTTISAARVWFCVEYLMREYGIAEDRMKMIFLAEDRPEMDGVEWSLRRRTDLIIEIEDTNFNIDDKETI